MDLIRASIDRPVAVLVGVIMVFMFGTIGLFSMPYQLSPSVTEPVITVTTTWVGATPYEIESDIIEEQEKVLKGIPGLIEMESTCYNGQGEVTLKFRLGTDVDNALLRVSNKMGEVRSYPDTADKPVISATGASTSPVIWMMLKSLPGNERPAQSYLTFFENEVRQYIERVPGVADLFMGGGRESQMQVVVDPEKLAAFDLTIAQVTAALQAANVDVSAGNMHLGRRAYRIRTTGQFRSPGDVEAVVLRSDGRRRVTLGDVGHAAFGLEKYEVAMLHNGEPGIAVGVKPEPDTNILDMTNAVDAVVQDLNGTILKEQGLAFDWAYDQRPYINGAIGLVQQNILIGGALAVLVLFTFLRAISSTVIVALAIPISVIGSFIFMHMFGRNLNVISLAGISFAVGMLVDNAIVVLENIDRHRHALGKSPWKAAYDGASEVWGAILASTLTTVAVFLPVVFMEEEAGQLFKDIAIAVTCAVSLSMFVSVSVIPMLASKFYSFGESSDKRRAKRAAIRERMSRGPLTLLGRRIAGGVMALVGLAIRNWATRLVTVAGMTLLAVVVTWAFFPKMEYLPQGNRNLILNILIPPPGLSVDEFQAMGEHVYQSLKPFIGQDEVNGLPGIEDTFYVGAERINLFGVISTKEQRAGELLPFLSGVCNSMPGVFGVSLQVGVFQTSLGGGRTINVDLSGDSVEGIAAAGGPMYGAISQAIPGSQIRPVPSLELTFPEVRLVPDPDRVTAAGLTVEQVGQALDVLMDGRQIDDFKEEGKKKIDLVLKASEEEIATPEQLYASLLVTSDGRLVPVSSLARLVRTQGISQIRHLERRRTITLEVTPPPAVPLEQAMDIISGRIVPGLEQAGVLEGIKVTLAGAADKLTTARQSLQWNFLLAVAIIYLLMSALFGNFLYPLIILFTVPLAGAGGFLGLKLENIFLAQQPLDILTMLGFVILIGVVVNNAILIVHQSLNNVRDGGMEHKAAVLEATSTRLRPIYMSATTSIFGMLPLAVAPGPGSELYRGLGSVILGGLAVSTVFTVFVIPCLLMFFIKMETPGSRNGKNGNGKTETGAAETSA